MEIKINNIHIATIHWNGNISFRKIFILAARQFGKNNMCLNLNTYILYHTFKKKEYIKNCKGVSRKYRRLVLSNTKLRQRGAKKIK